MSIEQPRNDPARIKKSSNNGFYLRWMFGRVSAPQVLI
jgi:hypothetical protein